MANTSINELSKSLETLYLDGKLEEAVDFLLKNKPVLSPIDFHYNLGVVYTKLGQFGPGRYQFELAMKEGYLGSDILNNLNVIKSQIQVADISSSDHFYDQLLNTFSSIPMAYSFSIALVLILTLLILFRVKLLKSKKFLAVSIFFSLTPIALHSYFITGKSFAISINEMKIYEGPSAIYDVKQTMPGGAKFITGKSDKGWFYIDYPVEISGWVKKEDIGLL
ncbi:SH3 domain-containing protein [Halobacteriovorax sp. HLS]|uniref:SH3 domain-containing protein n=1 Tax=Halobacteriovorax sp. HLS TaxID=2234000 RepID=UPI000FDC981C|nr:SH3 domain-containing protein [Halobacteriovorax sp. HLS]